MQKQYIKLFINNKSESIHSFHDLSKQGMKGLMFLKLEPKLVDKSLQTFSEDGQDY